MRFKLVIFIILLYPTIMKSQNASATLGNITSCAGENVLVPVDVTGFIDVGAMTIYISFDTNSCQFLSLQNINPEIPGSISVNSANGQVNVAYSYVIPFNIIEGKLFDLSFTFLGDSTSLPFLPGTEIANSNLEVIPLDTYPGSISTGLQIINQPDSVQSYPDNDVIFRVTSLGNPNYQWQENTGSGWTDLQNNSTYTGVDSDTLTVHDVSLDFNGYTYRCELSSGNCTAITDTALLEVALAFPAASLGFISSCPDNQVFEPLNVGDFFDVIEFTFNISFDTADLAFQDLANINPVLSVGDMSVAPMMIPPGISIHWTSTDPISISSDKLFDLKFDYSHQENVFAFEAGTEALNSFSNPINITLNNGIITQYSVPLITIQPQNDTVTEPQDAHFSLTASGVTGYQWQKSTDGGNSWTDLSDNPPYFNVHTSELTISPAVYSMNENRFSCRLQGINCISYSGTAILTVDTLTYISSNGTQASVLVYPVPCREVVMVELPDNSTYDLARIFDAQGKLQLSSTIDRNSSAKMGINVSSLPQGLYILSLEGTNEGKIITELKKIMKTN
jgi:hypothetical protein